MKCECPDKGVLNPAIASMYDPYAELPFVEHAPGKCRCTNDLKLYRRGEKTLWLCSCCITTKDYEVET
jgi:hypothetical protein